MLAVQLDFGNPCRWPRGLVGRPRQGRGLHPEVNGTAILELWRLHSASRHIQACLLVLLQRELAYASTCSDSAERVH